MNKYLFFGDLYKIIYFLNYILFIFLIILEKFFIDLLLDLICWKEIGVVE